MLLSAPLPLVSASPPTNLVADIKGPKMLNRVWASIFARWFGDWGEGAKRNLYSFNYPKNSYKTILSFYTEMLN